MVHTLVCRTAAGFAAISLSLGGAIASAQFGPQPGTSGANFAPRPAFAQAPTGAGDFAPAVRGPTSVPPSSGRPAVAGPANRVPAVGQASPVSTTPTRPDPVYFKVDSPQQKLEMTVNSSRILSVDFNIPKYLVNNREVAAITPLAANQIQVTAAQPGVTQINLWNEQGEITTVDVVVFADAQELNAVLAAVFPEAQLKVLPTAGSVQGSVIVSGYVADRESIPRILEVAGDFYPNVIDNIDVGGTQQVQLHVKVMEVSRTKLQQAGIDWGLILGNQTIVQNAGNLISAAAIQAGSIAGAGAGTWTFGVVDGQTQLLGALQLLEQHNLAKLLAEPTLMTISGRAASFNSGGEVPIPVAAGLGTTSVEYRPFGTGLDFVPIVLGNGKLRMEIRPVVREVDETLSDPVTGSPGFRTRQVDTAVEMRPGQTLALAGLLQTRISSTKQGIPYLMDLPWIGAAFRTVNQQKNEVELLILVTPELVAPLEAHEVPPCLPGEYTTGPDRHDFYCNGYLEVPKSDRFSQYVPGPVDPNGRPCLNGACGPGVAVPMHGAPMHGGRMQGPAYTAPPTYGPGAFAPPRSAPANGMIAPETLPQNGPVEMPSESNVPGRLNQPTRAPVIEMPAEPETVEPSGGDRQASRYQGRVPGLIGPVGYDRLR